MLDAPKERINKAKAGRERVLSNYTYEHNAEDFERIYKSIINK
jgi:spore maturation protein CgeB